MTDKREMNLLVLRKTPDVADGRCGADGANSILD